MSNVKTQSYNANVKSNLRFRSYEFSISIIKFVSDLHDKRIYWVITDQLLRSATSIGANIIESTASSSKKDFIHFYQIALKSANETKYWLCLLRDTGLVGRDKIEDLLQEAIEISKMLAASLLTLKGRK